MAAFVLAFALLQLSVIGWDQPSAIGWENDGVAPRDFLRGVAGNLAWGQAHRYPLFHNLLLSALCAPVLGGFALAGPATRAAIEARVLSLPCMTAVSLSIKLAHVTMGAGLLLVLARIARRLFRGTAGRFAVLCAMTNLTIGYYTRASNLDGPYMFWSVLAIDRVLDVLERGERADYGWLAAFVAASVATKDQAYAGYVLALPIYLFVLPAARMGFAAAGAAHARNLRFAALVCAGSYAAMTGAIVNPTGFVARVRMLLGTNSEDWRTYARSAAGLWRNVRDLWNAQTEFFWHGGVVAACWLGVGIAIFGLGKDERAPSTRGSLLPITAGLSSVLAFTLPVARCEHRFLLPLGVWLCVYGGVCLSWLWSGAWTRALAWLGCASLAISALSCVGLALTQWGDARHEIERALDRLPRGSLVEIYGYTVFEPRVRTDEEAPYRVQRIGKEPAAQRTRWPGVTELRAPYAAVNSRDATVLVVARGFAERFFARTFGEGESPSAKWSEAQTDADAVSFFRAVAADAVPGYRVVMRAEPQLPSWATALGARPVRIHDSTADVLWLLRRTP